MNSHAKRVATMAKKTFQCPEHGKFVGFAWGGHRRTCRIPLERNEAGEVKKEYFFSVTKKVDLKLSMESGEEVTVGTLFYNPEDEKDIIHLLRKSLDRMEESMNE